MGGEDPPSAGVGAQRGSEAAGGGRPQDTGTGTGPQPPAVFAYDPPHQPGASDLEERGHDEQGDGTGDERPGPAS